MAKWVYLQKNTKTREKVQSSAVPESILNMLEERGIEGDEAVEDFLSDHPKAAYDPFLLPDLSEAVDRILDAVKDGKKICIYGDYDADGVTSTALLLSVLGRLTDNLCYHIPSRFKEGYGLNVNAIQQLADEGTELIVTVDCGSTSPDEVEFAKQRGVEVIVTDHHSPYAGKDPGCLFVNPKRPGSNYPFSGLSGCGVAFKIAQGLCARLQQRNDGRFTRKDLHELLDLVAISTIADVVPLLDENRTFVKYGLKRINAGTRPGLKILLDLIRKDDKDVVADNVAFIIAPNINALGRIGSASIGVELLAFNDKKKEEELRQLAEEMLDNNRQRKQIQEETLQQCLKVMEEEDCGEFFPIIFAPNAHEGVAGIVAGNLKEQLYRPVFIITDRCDGQLKGTGRGVPGMDLHGMLTTCPELFSRFGGHAGACGLSMPAENLTVFREKMQGLVEKALEENPELLTEKIVIEKELVPWEKSIKFVNMLNKLEPYGEANPRPVFSISSASVSGIAYMGSENQHVRFSVRNSDGIPVGCVLFRRAAEFSDLLRRGNVVDVCGELSVNEYNGNSRLQMLVHDIRRSR